MKKIIAVLFMLALMSCEDAPNDTEDKAPESCSFNYKLVLIADTLGESGSDFVQLDSTYNLSITDNTCEYIGSDRESESGQWDTVRRTGSSLYLFDEYAGEFEITLDGNDAQPVTKERESEGCERKTKLVSGSIDYSQNIITLVFSVDVFNKDACILFE